MKKKKGLSEVVTSLIIILLVLVAIGVIWVVVQNLIDNSTGQINYGVACLKVDVDITDASRAVNNPSTNGVNETKNTAVVTLSRGSDSEAVSGVKVIVSDGTKSAETKVTTLTTLGTASGSVSLTGTDVWPDTADLTVTAVPYFTDDGGNEQLCQNVKTYKITA